MVKLAEVECLKCGYKWNPHVPNPRVCARCKTHYWNTPPEKVKLGRPPKKEVE